MVDGAALCDMGNPKEDPGNWKGKAAAFGAWTGGPPPNMDLKGSGPGTAVGRLLDIGGGSKKDLPMAALIAGACGDWN